MRPKIVYAVILTSIIAYTYVCTCTYVHMYVGIYVYCAALLLMKMNTCVRFGAIRPQRTKDMPLFAEETHTYKTHENAITITAKTTAHNNIIL